MQLGLKEVVEKNIKGQAVTPYLLKRLNEITQGVSLGSNIDLVKNNAKIGSQVRPTRAMARSLCRTWELQESDLSIAARCFTCTDRTSAV